MFDLYGKVAVDLVKEGMMKPNCYIGEFSLPNYMESMEFRVGGKRAKNFFYTGSLKEG